MIAGLFILVLGILLIRERGSASEQRAEKPTASGAGGDVEQRCASQQTYDRIKLELFRRAVETRGSGREPFDRLSTYSVARMERPLLTDYDKELGTVRCSGRLSLDLPPGVAVVGGRRALSADIDYLLQPAADGSGDVVMLEGADPIIIPLATLAPTSSGPALPSSSAPAAIPGESVTRSSEVLAPQSSQTPAQEPAPPIPATRENAQAERPAMTSRPSFNCRYARTRSEIAVCSDGRLAALDREMAAQYLRAIANADARERRLLTSTRDQFLRHRDRCTSEACIAQSYRGRMRQISDIEASRLRN
ncbi:hypothetical protein D3M59_11330 [Sphingomonas edaphi]|uniref:DUF1311 domain-containing protein n=1 Tax=Sphingomonas edaphi TaxID=2315689 RepID=A0A418PYM2_9SPHN|nr:hypothetical protein D3M59_11330 [Sphingomonas edaphi]